MKVYIVTDGSYSDYSIQRVFSNLPAAEEYKKWHNIRNEIEEYDVCDEPFTASDGEKAMSIRVEGMVYPEAVVALKYDIKPCVIYNNSITHNAGVWDRRGNGVFNIFNYHCIPADRWDEEKYKAKFTKALYDLAGLAKLLFADGASNYQVSCALSDDVKASAEED